ncbi:hypothetical protein ACFXOS_18885 [Streptomyces sp. NPDC059175]|uniref:hypothetical protein n=1 Tax=Streptomyces sp. NPDC059175 TaxID=3346757 RepID=UPI00368A9A95
MVVYGAREPPADHASELPTRWSVTTAQEQDAEVPGDRRPGGPSRAASPLPYRRTLSGP